jgi:hypothetical protein
MNKKPATSTDVGNEMDTLNFYGRLNTSFSDLKYKRTRRAKDHF